MKRIALIALCVVLALGSQSTHFSTTRPFLRPERRIPPYTRAREAAAFLAPLVVLSIISLSGLGDCLPIRRSLCTLRRGGSLGPARAELCGVRPDGLP